MMIYGLINHCSTNGQTLALKQVMPVLLQGLDALSRWVGSFEASRHHQWRASNWSIIGISFQFERASKWFQKWSSLASMEGFVSFLRAAMGCDIVLSKISTDVNRVRVQLPRSSKKACCIYHCMSLSCLLLLASRSPCKYVSTWGFSDIPGLTAIAATGVRHVDKLASGKSDGSSSARKQKFNPLTWQETQGDGEVEPTGGWVTS